MYTQYSTLYVYATKYFSCKLLVIWKLDFIYLFINACISDRSWLVLETPLGVLTATLSIRLNWPQILVHCCPKNML